MEYVSPASSAARPRTWAFAAVLLLSGCTYWDGAMRPDDPARERRVAAFYDAAVPGTTTRQQAEALLGPPYCVRPLSNGDIELRWAGPSTKVNAVHFLGVTTKRYVAKGGWGFPLVFHDDVMIRKETWVPGTDGSEPCVRQH
jgi:hypothetical protein